MNKQSKNASTNLLGISSGTLKRSTVEFFNKRKIKVDTFMALVVETSTPTMALRHLGIPYIEFSKVLERDETLQNRIQSAMDVSVEVAQGKLYEMAINGSEEVKKDSSGEIVETKLKPNDRCLLEFLKNNNKSQGKSSMDGISIPVKSF